jgi:hypothetical protein
MSPAEAGLVGNQCVAGTALFAFEQRDTFQLYSRCDGCEHEIQKIRVTSDEISRTGG